MSSIRSPSAGRCATSRRPDRIAFVAELAARWARLRTKPNAEKRVAIVLSNYPNKDGRIANGVGLDAPASTANVLKAMQDAGYDASGAPETGAELMALLLAGPTNARVGDARTLSHGERVAAEQPGEGLLCSAGISGLSTPHPSPPATPSPSGRRKTRFAAVLSLQAYAVHFARLPEPVRSAVSSRWGEPSSDPFVEDDAFVLAAHRFGNVAIGIQPARGYNIDPKTSYHDPDLVPPHAYFAFYFWLREEFGADALVHMGKHGNLEWLPGKALALSESCYPEAALGPLPVIYPFIVNDPGEGAQAKRRTRGRRRRPSDAGDGARGELWPGGGARSADRRIRGGGGERSAPREACRGRDRRPRAGAWLRQGPRHRLQGRTATRSRSSTRISAT